MGKTRLLCSYDRFKVSYLTNFVVNNKVIVFFITICGYSRCFTCATFVIIARSSHRPYTSSNHVSRFAEYHVVVIGIPPRGASPIPPRGGIPITTTWYSAKHARDLMTYTDDTYCDDHESRTRKSATITTYSYKKDDNFVFHNNISTVKHLKTFLACPFKRG